MFLRTVLFGVLGAITGVIAAGLAPWLAGDPPFEAIYWLWAAAVGFVGGMVANIVCEFLGYYKMKTSLWQRFFTGKRD